MGINYSDMMRLTLDELNNLTEAFESKNRDEMNKLFYTIHQQALYNALANHGSKSFPREPKRIAESGSGDYNRNDKNGLDSLHDLARSLMPHIVDKRANHS